MGDGRRTGEVCFLLVALAGPCHAARAASAQPSVGLASSLTTVPRRGPFRTEPALRLEAARGEYECAQVVIRADGQHEVRAIGACVSALTDPGGARQPPPRLYRVAYVRLDTPSSIEGRAGEWPDPLVPDVDAYA